MGGTRTYLPQKEVGNKLWVCRWLIYAHICTVSGLMCRLCQNYNYVALQKLTGMV